jgi:hypothetical protein
MHIDFVHNRSYTRNTGSGALRTPFLPKALDVATECDDTVFRCHADLGRVNAGFPIKFCFHTSLQFQVSVCPLSFVTSIGAGLARLPESASPNEFTMPQIHVFGDEARLEVSARCSDGFPPIHLAPASPKLFSCCFVATEMFLRFECWSLANAGLTKHLFFQRDDSLGTFGKFAVCNDLAQDARCG